MHVYILLLGSTASTSGLSFDYSFKFKFKVSLTITVAKIAPKLQQYFSKSTFMKYFSVYKSMRQTDLKMQKYLWYFLTLCITIYVYNKSFYILSYLVQSVKFAKFLNKF